MRKSRMLANIRVRLLRRCQLPGGEFSAGSETVLSRYQAVDLIESRMAEPVLPVEYLPNSQIGKVPLSQIWRIFVLEHPAVRACGDHTPAPPKHSQFWKYRNEPRWSAKPPPLLRIAHLNAGTHPMLTDYIENNLRGHAIHAALNNLCRLLAGAKLKGSGVPEAKRATLKKIAIPSEIWADKSTVVDFANSEILDRFSKPKTTRRLFSHIEISLPDHIDSGNAEAKPPAQVGKPSRRQLIDAAIRALGSSEALQEGISLKQKIDLVRRQVLESTGLTQATGLSDETIRRRIRALSSSSHSG
jgi:hypothetical protein